MTTRAHRRPGTDRAGMQWRAHWANVIRTTTVICRRCHTPIRPGQPFERGHPANAPYAFGNKDHDLAPEHRTCNKAGLVADQPPTFAW